MGVDINGFDIMMFVYVGCLFIGAPLAGVIIGLVLGKKQKKDSNAEEENAVEEPVYQPKSEFIEVKVVSKRIYTQFTSIRMPRSIFWFYVTFETAGGERMELAVPQEKFEKMQENQEGTLVLVNGAFFDFGDGEVMETETKEELI